MHRHQGGVVDQGAQHLAQFQIAGDEHAAVEAGVGGDGGGGVGQVAGGGATHRGEAQLPGAGEGHTHHPVLKRKRRHVDAVVLDVEALEAEPLGQVAGLEQRRKARAYINGIAFNRQEFSVAPDGCGARLDRGPAHPIFDRLVVVDNFERSEADVFADVASARFVGMAAFFAAQSCEGGAGEGGSHSHAQRSPEANSVGRGTDSIPTKEIGYLFEAWAC